MHSYIDLEGDSMNSVGLTLLFVGLVALGFWGLKRMRSWIVKVLLFIVFILGGAQAAMANMSLDAGVVLLFNVLLFIGAGVVLLKFRSGSGDVFFGLVVLVVGAIMILPAFESLGMTVPSTILNGISQSFGRGWETFLDMLERAFIS